MRPHSWDTRAIIRKELGGTVEISDLDLTHRIGAIKEYKSKCRPIIGKFSRYNVRDKVFKKMKKFTGKGYSVTESLTAMRMKKLTEASNSFGFTNVRTQDEKIHLYFIIIYIQREKTHNFSGVLNIFCGKICFSSFLVNLQTNKPSLC